MLGLTIGQLLTLAAVGALLIVVLLVLRAALRLTKGLLRLGCLGILAVIAVVFVLMRTLAG